jgi:hypothetical protein
MRSTRQQLTTALTESTFERQQELLRGDAEHLRGTTLDVDAFYEGHWKAP